jgi:hypothetical protein
MLRLAAQYADLWNTFNEIRPEDVATTLAPLDAACADVGRDPATLGRVLLVPVNLPGPRQHPPSTAYGLDRATMGVESGVLLSGEPEAIAEGLRAYARSGIEHVIVWLDPETVESIEAFAPVLNLLDRGGSQPSGWARRSGCANAAIGLEPGRAWPGSSASAHLRNHRPGRAPIKKRRVQTMALASRRCSSPKGPRRA